MLSPLMTVIVLVVLWLIVVVPMVLRRSDEVRRERSVAGFGSAMRALGRRVSAPRAPGVDTDGDVEVYVPHRSDRARRAPLAAPERRPVPAAQEASMYPPEDADLSEARTQMMSRRRRSMAVLGGGSLLFVLMAVVMSGLMWVVAGAFVAAFAGYLWFLRSQALRDQARRDNRQERAEARRATGYDVTERREERTPANGYLENVDYVEIVPSTVVRIDDDDFELQSMDTIDLTGLYSEDSEPAAFERRAS